MDFGVLYLVHTGRLFYRVKYVKRMEIMRYCISHIEIFSIVLILIFMDPCIVV
jgi:hypothetical protein